MSSGTALLIIDVQKEFMNDINGYSMVKHINDYIETERYDKVIGTVFRNSIDSNFIRLLNWNDCMDDTVSAVKCDEVWNKNGTYGLTYDILERLKEYEHVDIIGMDIDACVMAAAFQLFDANIDFSILTDMCFSSGGEVIHKAAIEIMKRNFGKAVV